MDLPKIVPKKSDDVLEHSIFYLRMTISIVFTVYRCICIEPAKPRLTMVYPGFYGRYWRACSIQNHCLEPSRAHIEDHQQSFASNDSYPPQPQYEHEIYIDILDNYIEGMIWIKLE